MTAWAQLSGALRRQWEKNTSEGKGGDDINVKAVFRQVQRANRKRRNKRKKKRGY